jgi:hypothetical protein
MYSCPFSFFFFILAFPCIDDNYHKENRVERIGKGGIFTMQTGRDMTELSMMSINEWENNELAYFHHSLQQMVPYLNSEGQSIHRKIVEEIQRRGGLKTVNGDGAEMVYD